MVASPSLVDRGKNYLKRAEMFFEPGPFFLLKATAVLWLVMLLSVAQQAAETWRLGISADSDSVMRAVQIRDLLAGQGWFDLHQYRMGDAMLMHWSRISDLLPAGTIALLKPFVGPDVAERVALVSCPLVLMIPFVFLILATAVNMAGPAALLPAGAVILTSQRLLPAFNPGALDHHNMQVIALMLLLWACTGHRGKRDGLWAGLAIILSLTVGVEALPYLFSCLLIAGILWIKQPTAERPFILGIGTSMVGLTLFSALVFMPRPWSAQYCDNWTLPIACFSMGVGVIISGAAILTPWMGGSDRKSIWMRGGYIVVGLALLAGIIATAFPVCLRHPFGDDPLIWRYWVNYITELQGVWGKMQRNFWDGYIFIAAVPACLCFGIWCAIKEARTAWFFVWASAAVGLAITLSEVRGFQLMTASSLPLAAALITVWRAQTDWRQTACWVVFTSYPYIFLCSALDPSAFDKPPSDASQVYCIEPDTIAALRRLPPSRILFPIHAEPWFLHGTKHSSYAGAYHHNWAPNLASFKAFVSPPEQARPIVESMKIEYILMCPGYVVPIAIAPEHPEGLGAALMRRQPPAWLSIVMKRPHNVTLYRVDLNREPKPQ